MGIFNVDTKGIGEAVKGLGGLAKDLRTVVKGYELKPEHKVELEGILSKIDNALVSAQSAIVTAEAAGGWLQRNWRPMLMTLFGVIIFNNYIIHPYVSLFFPGNSVMLEIPEAMWGLLKIGVGGYVVGRSLEKAVNHYSNKG